MLAGVAFVAGAGCRDSDSCVDTDSLSTGEASLRASFHYAARSPYGEAKQCRGCQFFRAKDGDTTGCGECQILQGPVNGQGHCDSWSARA
jgi:hypothetical protein